jgi:hypothetical protein
MATSNPTLENVQKLEIVEDLKKVLNNIKIIKIWLLNPIITDYLRMLKNFNELFETIEKYNYNIPELSAKLEEYNNLISDECFFCDELINLFYNNDLKINELLNLINSFEHFELLGKYLNKYNYFDYIQEPAAKLNYNEFKDYKRVLLTTLIKTSSNFYTPEAVQAVKNLIKFYKSFNFKTWWWEVLEDIEKERKEEQNKEEEYAKFVYGTILNYIYNN